MATNYQRVQAIGDAIVNGTATPEQLAKFGEALYAVSPSAWAAMTDAEKLAMTIQKVRQWANYTILQYDREQAAIAAAAGVSGDAM